MGGPAGRRGRCPHRPAPATGGSVRRGRSNGAAKRTRDARPYGGIAAPIRSAKAYWRCWFVCLRRGTFHRSKVPKMRRGLRPRTPLGLCGVHPRGRHLPGRYAPPGHPVPYCLPLPGFARARRIGQLYGYRTFLKGRTNCPRTGGRCCTRQLLRTNITVHAVGAAISRPPSNVIGAPVANVPESDSTVGADAHIGPCRVSGLSQRARRLWKATCIAAPLWLQ